MKKVKQGKVESFYINNNSDKKSSDSSYYNFQFLKKINRDFLNDTTISKYDHSSFSGTESNNINDYIPLMDNDNSRKLHKKYEEKRAKELKNLVLKMNNIINEEYLYKNTEDDEEKEYYSNYYENSNDERNFFKPYKDMKKEKMYQYEEKKKILKQFNKDLLDFSSLLENKKKQLRNRENKVKYQESKIKKVLSEFDRIINEDKTWKKDLENLRKDYQSSIDILNRENKRLVQQVNELSNKEEQLIIEVRQKNLEIEELKMKNENINNEKNKIQEITNELKGEITKLKKKIKDIQGRNTQLHENYERLSKKYKGDDDFTKEVGISVKPGYKSMEIQTENSNILERIINQQYLDIKKVFTILHYILQYFYTIFFSFL